ncbi:MAG: Na+/H+ antiporter subunit E [Candidatus Omnitrophota bacterium]
MNRATTFILSFALWLLLTWTFDPVTVLLGLGMAGVTSFILADDFRGKPHKFWQPRRYGYFLRYIPFFAYELARANFLMAYRILSPKLPIKPGLVKARTGLKSHTGRAFLANSITLTPGTMTVDMQEDTLYIHWIYTPTTDEKEVTRKIPGPFEKYLQEVFE